MTDLRERIAAALDDDPDLVIPEDVDRVLAVLRSYLDETREERIEVAERAFSAPPWKGDASPRGYTVRILAASDALLLDAPSREETT